MRALAWIAVAAVSVGACHHGASPGAAADGGPGAAPVAPARAGDDFPPIPASPPHARDRAPLPCRVIALEGKAVAEDPARPLALQAGLPDAWIDVGDATRLVAKDPRTTRETTFRGPARVRDCVGGVEEAWVAGGSFESTAGAGEAPGAEEWVATPQGVIRYAAAKLRADVRPTGTAVTMVAGVAFLWPPAPPAPGARHDAGPLDEGWQRLPTGTTTTGPALATGDAVDRCTTLAERARTLTAALISTGSGPPSGAQVTEQVTTRRLARAACAVAEVRTRAPATGDRPDRPDAASTAWTARLAAADAAWRSLPVATAAP